MTLHRRCVGALGYGVGELRQRRRVARARELLTDADLPLARIAARCGYGSRTRFGEVFRRRTGMTPAAYRRAILLEETAG